MSRKSYPVISGVTWVRAGLLRYLSTPAVRVFLALLAHFDNRNSQAYPKVAKLAWEAGITERATYMALAELKQAGVIENAGYTRFSTTRKRATAIYELRICDSTVQAALDKRHPRRKRRRGPSPEAVRQGLKKTSPEVAAQGLQANLKPSPEVPRHVSHLSPEVPRHISASSPEAVRQGEKRSTKEKEESSKRKEGLIAVPYTLPSPLSEQVQERTPPVSSSQKAGENEKPKSAQTGAAPSKVNPKRQKQRNTLYKDLQAEKRLGQPQRSRQHWLDHYAGTSEEYHPEDIMAAYDAVYGGDADAAPDAG